jgi:hypothetical protein
MDGVLSSCSLHASGFACLKLTLGEDGAFGVLALQSLGCRRVRRRWTSYQETGRHMARTRVGVEELT